MQFTHNFEEIISPENLLEAWKEFLKGKRGKQDVQAFSLLLMDHIFSLHTDLREKNYRHGGYQAFTITDPKPRNIHKASVRDRLLHHAIYRKLYPFFDKTFIADSFSCRMNKGTHKALNRFQTFSRKVSKNNTKTCWVLQGDIKKFFENIDHSILINVLGAYIPNRNIAWLLQEIIESFSSVQKGVGLALGNLTSQLFVNIYMNEFDKFVKHKLKARYYIRYADDFAIFSENSEWLKFLLIPIGNFLWNKLRLQLHPQKISIKTLASGVDFLGWVHFPSHRVLRTTTKRRMLKKLRDDQRPEVLNSYLGLLKHGNAYNLKKSL